MIKKLIADGPFDITQFSIVSSPLKRAQESAEIISKLLNLTAPYSTSPTFRELSLGRWEGLTSQEVKDQHYEERKSRKSNRWDFRPVGGESMADRMPDIKEALVKLPPFSIIVTHSVVLRIIFHLLGAGSKEECAALETPHDEILWWNGAKLHRQPFKC